MAKKMYCCPNCKREIGFKGFCSEECYYKYYEKFIDRKIKKPLDTRSKRLLKAIKNFQEGKPNVKLLPKKKRRMI